MVRDLLDLVAESCRWRHKRTYRPSIGGASVDSLYSNFGRSVKPMGEWTLKINVVQRDGQQVIIAAGLVYQPPERGRGSEYTDPRG